MSLNPSASLKKTSSTSENTLTEKKSKEDQRATQIWIIGSSYIRQGELAASEKFGENFGLNAKVQWFGIEELCWCSVLPYLNAKLAGDSPPDILVIHAGGNDLELIPASELCSAIKEDLIQLHTMFPSMTIAYSCINERQVWIKKMNKDREFVNASIRKAVDGFGGVVIEHPHLRSFDKTIFLPDGVNFTKEGNDLFLTSIHSAIKTILQSLHRK